MSEESAPEGSRTDRVARWWSENPSVMLIGFVLLDLFQEESLSRLIVATLAALVAGALLSRFMNLRKSPRAFVTAIAVGFAAEVAAMPLNAFGRQLLGYATFLLSCFLISLAYFSCEFKKRERRTK